MPPPLLAHCTAAAGASANFTRCEFSQNSASNVGGALSIGGGVSVLQECTFVGNSAGAPVPGQP